MMNDAFWICYYNKSMCCHSMPKRPSVTPSYLSSAEVLTG